jgi:hypothetical protein
VKLTLLTRPECGLCEEFAAELASHRPDLEVEHADVDSRPEWARRWGLKIPVLLAADGQLVCAERFDAGAVDALLRGRG